MSKSKESDFDVRKVFGQWVRQLRNDAAMTQVELAASCGIFRTYLSRIESGTANPSIDVVAALAAALGVKVTKLFETDTH